ncbi:Acyl-CoA-binding domain-containing protein 2 [Nymphaea thermarum]|nr:Acyl-CoA-binding domain-containing protein 2 [Nymphaea thermarum]
MGGDSQELEQPVLLGFIFSFLVAKLLSVVFAFRQDENRRVGGRFFRSSSPSDGMIILKWSLLSVVFAFRDGNLRVVREDEVALQATGEGATPPIPFLSRLLCPRDHHMLLETAGLAFAAGDQSAQKVPTDVYLQLYGYCKIAKEVPAESLSHRHSKSRPGPNVLLASINSKLLRPTPNQGHRAIATNDVKWHHQWKENRGGDSGTSGAMGTVFSSWVHEEDSDSELYASFPY